MTSIIIWTIQIAACRKQVKTSTTSYQLKRYGLRRSARSAEIWRMYYSKKLPHISSEGNNAEIWAVGHKKWGNCFCVFFAMSVSEIYQNMQIIWYLIYWLY